MRGRPSLDDEDFSQLLGSIKSKRNTLRRTPSSDMPLPAPFMPRADNPPQQQSDKRTRRGKFQPHRIIDLHDQTQDQALTSLVRAIHHARAEGLTQLLVITGKGSVRTGGVLRRMLPEWLARADIAPMIASYSSAHIKHGGSGAYYVRLKRVRNRATHS